MDNVQVDFGSVLIAAILYMVIGFLWYSKWLFGSTWMRLSKIKETEIDHNKLAILWGFIVALIIAYFLAVFQSMTVVTTVSSGMLLSFCVWLGFVATTQLSPVIWCKASPKLFFIDTGAKLLALLVMGGVIGA